MLDNFENLDNLGNARTNKNTLNSERDKTKLNAVSVT